MTTVQPTVPTRPHSPGEFHLVLELLAARPHLVQGVYYVILGLWPWLHPESYLWAAGSDLDIGLLQTLGLTLAVIGVSLAVAAARREESWAIHCLALGSIAALLFSNILFLFRDRFAVLYVLDAVLQVILGALWFLHWQMPRSRLGSEPHPL
jgi:Na+/melibiose symporter-like transporter